MLVSGVSGTIKWTLEDDGTLYFVPVDGKEGTFADTQRGSREWEPYNKSIKQIKSKGLIHLAKDSSFMFHGCSLLENIDLSNFDTSNVANMGNMFSDCRSLANLNLSSFNTSKATNLNGMFYCCSSLKSCLLYTSPSPRDS